MKNENKFYLSWFTASGANSYNLKRATTDGAETNFINTSGATYSNARVVNGTTYIYVVSAVISGDGFLIGNFTLASGATLAPGNQDLGALIFSNSLTLNSGSKAILSVSHDSQTNNFIFIQNNFASNGSLIVSNADDPLQAGDSFQLFSARNFSGNFISVTLPTLTSGLYWITNTLAVNGIVSVGIETPPLIGNISFANGKLILSGAGGMTNGTYYILTSTNLATPITNWTFLSINQFAGSGNFNFTNSINSNSSQNFYLLQLL